MIGLVEMPIARARRDQRQPEKLGKLPWQGAREQDCAQGPHEREEWEVEPAPPDLPFECAAEEHETGYGPQAVGHRQAPDLARPKEEVRK
jgi:hypothetical protein